MKYFVYAFASLGKFIITISCIFVMVFSYLLSFVPFEFLELKSYDLRLISRGKIRPSGDIVLAVIDEKSLEKEGRWPWPRKKLAQMVNILSEEGAKVIAFDIGFLEPDQGVSREFVNDLESSLRQLDIDNNKITSLLQTLEQRHNNDLTLVRAFKKSKAQIVLGYFFYMTKQTLNYSIAPQEIEEELAKLEKSKYPLVVFEKQNASSDPFIEAYVPIGNLRILTEAAPYSGYFNIFTDQDGVVRRIPLVLKCGEDLYPPLSIQAAWHYLGRPQLLVKVSEHGIKGVRIGSRFLPTDAHGQLMINYLGPPKTFPHISITDILNRSFPKNIFKNTVVLVGATAIGIYDQRNTPFSPVYPGLEVHATIVDNIMKQRFIIKPKWSKIFDLLSVVFLGLLAGALASRQHPLRAGIFILIVLAGHLAMTLLFFMLLGVWLSVVYPGITAVLTYSIFALINYLTQGTQQKKIKNAFTCYLSPSVAKKTIKALDFSTLSGEQKNLTVLFSDIRRFNSLLESSPPQDMVRQLNEYFTRMTEVVFRYQGTLDKFIGDAVMAIYGAPLDQEEHADLACRTSLDMIKELEQLNLKWVTDGMQALDIGIGINTGQMIVGNMGSEQKFTYTVAGKPVNIAHLLEEANKLYGTKILISEYTYNYVKEKFACMEVDRVRTEYSKLPITIYQLVGDEHVPEKKMEAMKYFVKGLGLYRQRRWDKAIEFFQYVYKIEPSMQVAELYIRRCKGLKKDPPPAEWDGTFSLAFK